MPRPSRLYIFGASGSGTTTLGGLMAEELGVPHVDSDDHFWHPTDPPFTHRRTPSERAASMAKALGPGGWVISGSCHNWASKLIDQADLFVFLTVPTPLRLARIKTREQARFGDRISEGGDMFAIHTGFMQWSRSYDDPSFTGRSLAAHETWISYQTKPLLRIDGDPSRDHAKALVLQRLRDL